MPRYNPVPETPQAPQQHSLAHRRRLAVLGCCGVLLVAGGLVPLQKKNTGDEEEGQPAPAVEGLAATGPSSEPSAWPVADEGHATVRTPDGPLPLPTGVNLGGWLSLEDYFYVGKGGGVSVDTPTDGSYAAACLPPLIGERRPWHSETDLLTDLLTLNETTTVARLPGLGRTAAERANAVFRAHRNMFVDLETEFAEIRRLGMQKVGGAHSLARPDPHQFSGASPPTLPPTTTLTPIPASTPIATPSGRSAFPSPGASRTWRARTATTPTSTACSGPRCRARLSRGCYARPRGTG